MMRPTLKMDDDEFEAFRRSVVIPMIRRHQEMFPRMHRPDLMKPSKRGARVTGAPDGSGAR